MKMISLFALVSLLSSTTLKAGSIEVAQWIPWNFVKKELSSLPLDLNVTEPSLVLDLGELRPSIKNLQFVVEGDLENLMIDGRGMNGEANDLRADFQLEEIKVDQVIVREFNGNRITIVLKAVCEPIKVSLNKFSVKVKSEFVEDGVSFRPAVTALDLGIEQGQWTHTPVKCSGIQGADHQIAQMLNQSLANPSSFNDHLKEKVAVVVEDLWKESWQSMVQMAGSQMKVTSMGRPSDNGFMLFAELPLKTKKVVEIAVINEQKLSKVKPQLLFSKDGFNALLEDRFMLMAPQKFNLQSISAFNKLTKSRSMQYFAWPDLNRFNGSTPFLLSTNLSLSELLLKPQGPGQWKAELSANGVLEVEMSGALIDYLNWNVGVGADMSVSVKDSKLKISTGKSNLEMKWSFGLLYQMLFKPKNRIATDIMKSSLNQFFTNQTVEEDLPTLQIKNRQWKLQNWSTDDHIISMDWLEEV